MKLSRRKFFAWAGAMVAAVGAVIFFRKREPELLDWLRGRLDVLHRLPDGARWASMEVGRFYHMLRASECRLLELYCENAGEPMPEGCDGTDGQVAFGAALYWLNHTRDGFEGEVVRAIVKALEVFETEPLPKSKITPEVYARMQKYVHGQGLVDDEGTIFGEHAYEQLEIDWTLALAYYLFYQAEPHKVHAFGTTPQVFTVPKGSGSITIAVVGDWGTGRYGQDEGPALQVLRDIESLEPDYVIHIGDVYYAGSEGVEIAGRRFFSEEWDNFVGLWPRQWGYGTGKSFTLNSNHEMYDGANGYFNVALGKGAPFAHQKGTSYFSIEYGPWVLVGLDSAYHASPAKMFLDGSLGGPGNDQAKWIREHYGDRGGRNMIMLSHHNGMDYLGEHETPLWQEVKDAVGGKGPDYWYWGHVHQCAVYSDKCCAGMDVKPRLIGHGAIPIAMSSALTKAREKGIVEYFPKTMVGGDSNRVRNGFATLTLTFDGGITERFYETTATPGRPLLAWSSQA